MFGGIPSSFYTEYHKHLPKSAPEEEYDLRSDLYVLFHYLNHTVVFGVRPSFSNRVPRGQRTFSTGELRQRCGAEDGQAAQEFSTGVKLVCLFDLLSGYNERSCVIINKNRRVYEHERWQQCQCTWGWIKMMVGDVYAKWEW